MKIEPIVMIPRRIDIGQNPDVDEPGLQRSTANYTGKPKNDPKNKDERRLQVHDAEVELGVGIPLLDRLAVPLPASVSSCGTPQPNSYMRPSLFWALSAAVVWPFATHAQRCR
jgi:hypothetical protein